MKTTFPTPDSRASARYSCFVWAVVLQVLIMLLGLRSSHAGSATWNLNPTNGDWNTGANWTPATVPNGPMDTATFDVSNITDLSLSINTEVKAMMFNSGASAYTITAGPSYMLTISNTVNGIGIVNRSGVTQTFVTAAASLPGSIFFTNGANAGRETLFINNGAEVSHGNAGYIEFLDYSDAGNGTFINNGGTADGAFGGEVQFQNFSGAENGTFVNNGGTANDALGGVTSFLGTTFADNSTLIANGGSGGGKGGSITVSDFVNGGTARVEVFGDGNLDISFTGTGVKFGSIEGDGLVFLGAKNLTVGSNDLSTTFSGVIQDGGSGGGTGGSLTKLGNGRLLLASASTYTGGTTIKGKGEFVVSNISGSATGSGPVQVGGGMFGGTGTVAGPVTVGRGIGRGAVLAPGKSGAHPGTITIQSALIFNSNGTYLFGLNSDTGTADQVVASGVTINSCAPFSPSDVGASALSPGTVFTVISNTAATSIAGTFSNLPDGSTFTIGSNTFQANYEGGDGNDLTLTVVP